MAWTGGVVDADLEQGDRGQPICKGSSMSENYLLEGIKWLLGGGTLVGAVRAVTWWTKRQPEPGVVSVGRYLYFTVKNRCPSPIRVTIKVKPPHFTVMAGDTLEDGARALDGEDAAAFIEPDETRRFPIVGLDDAGAENLESRCAILVSWRSLRRQNIPQWPVWFSTTVRALQQREGSRP